MLMTHVLSFPLKCFYNNFTTNSIEKIVECWHIYRYSYGNQQVQELMSVNYWHARIRNYDTKKMGVTMGTTVRMTNGNGKDDNTAMKTMGTMMRMRTMGTTMRKMRTTTRRTRKT